MAITKWIPAFGAAPSTASAPSTSTTQQEEAIPVVTAADGKQFGLENFGNTCYANSVLQALYFCGPFRELVVQYPDPSFPEELLAPPPLPIPPPLPTSPPPSHARPKSSRKQSVSEPPAASPNCASPVVRPGLPIPPAPPTLLSALRSLYLHISKNPSDRGTVAPRAFIEKLKELNELFRSTMHQDAHEFLNYLLNQIVEEMDDDRKKLQNGNGSGSPSGTPGEDLSASVGTLSSTAAQSVAQSVAQNIAKNTLVHQLFEGVLTSETRCLTCETVSSRDESFLDLSIDIEQNSSVTACLRQFSASEMLCQRNKFFCDACCDLQEAEKRMKIKKLPNILALHLKRFKYQEDVGKYIKLAYRVAFPLELRLFNTVDDAQNPDRLYELFAIVVHIGNGPHHGHYVSVVKARGTWFLFDDDSVETIKESDISRYFGDSNAGAAYVLYYQAVDLDLSALGLRPPESESAAASTAPADSSVSQISTLATTLEADESTSHSPALPPGLTPEDQQTPSPRPDPSPPMFTHPFTPAAPLPIPQPQPSLSLDIPVTTNSADPITSSPTVGSTGTSNPKSFFNSIRHSPSIGFKGMSMRGPSSSSNGSDHRRSIIDAPPVPPIPVPSTSRSSATESHAESSSSLAASAPSPLLSPMVPNGKEKEKSSGNWFKRKSLRSDKRVSRRASEAGLTSLPSSPIVASAPSPASTPMRAMSPALRSVPEGRNPPLEVFSPTEKSDRRNSRQRPSTAGGAIERPRSEVAPPPLPPLPTQVMSAHPTSTPGSLANGLAHHHTGSPKVQRPHTSHASASPASLGLSASNGTTSTLEGSVSTTGSSAGATKPAKRATRKLSFTAPMLGFGRKEREKRPQTPTSSFPASMR
ncbi:cysteine proteinase [Phanerochaete sordida]|uniref:Ubiquitin carboxyl-terminal hydrolase n=1 Tax=Phanerochaete sordida TaxID=48140 RepID=A0A9P3LN01_9APHY|nr:cysteine proteinase [Phanerochaete sordida]